MNSFLDLFFNYPSLFLKLSHLIVQIIKSTLYFDSIRTLIMND